MLSLDPFLSVLNFGLSSSSVNTQGSVIMRPPTDLALRPFQPALSVTKAICLAPSVWPLTRQLVQTQEERGSRYYSSIYLTTTLMIN